MIKKNIFVVVVGFFVRKRKLCFEFSLQGDSFCEHYSTTYSDPTSLAKGEHHLSLLLRLLDYLTVKKTYDDSTLTFIPI